MKATLADARIDAPDAEKTKAVARILVAHLIDCSGREAVFRPMAQRVAGTAGDPVHDCGTRHLEAAPANELADVFAGDPAALAVLERACPPTAASISP